MEVKSQITKLLKQLNKGVYEKEEIMALSLLSAIAGESVFLLGAPGVAKSLIARRLKYAFKDGSSFEYLMNRFSTPDEIFGPVSISKLKDSDKYERIVTNYLPDATVVFLDEIWKAGPSIQNALLTVLNEKKYRNGEQEIDVPMKALLSASNELPAKGEGLEALWDRFLIRVVVEGINDEKNFNSMVTMPLKPKEATVTDNLKISNELYISWQGLINEVAVPENVLQVIHTIRKLLAENNDKTENTTEQLYISDRRWRKIVVLLRTAAFLNGRESVDLMDCFLIQHCIWNRPDQHRLVADIIKNAIQNHGYKLSLDLSEIKEELVSLNKDVKTETSYVKMVETVTLKKYEIEKKFYYRALIAGKFSYDVDDLIECSVIDNLTNNKYIETLRWRKDLKDKDPVWVMKSNEPTKFFMSNDTIQGESYDFETDTKTKKTILSKIPHPGTKKEWDKSIENFKKQIQLLLQEVNNYKANDLKHLRINLFVKPEFAVFVEKNIIDLEKEIGIIDVELSRIKYSYENIIDNSSIKK